MNKVSVPVNYIHINRRHPARPTVEDGDEAIMDEDGEAGIRGCMAGAPVKLTGI